MLKASGFLGFYASNIPNSCGSSRVNYPHDWIFRESFVNLNEKQRTNTMEQEAQWVAEIKKESSHAFRSVYDKYASKIRHVALGFHLDSNEARDIVQEVFLTLWEKRDTLREDSSLNAFLLTITKNKILNLHKKKAIQRAWQQGLIKSNDLFSTHTEDSVVYSDLEENTMHFIDSLPARKKQIFLLSRQEGFDNAEIADRLNLSIRTVENNIYQAEKTIREFLKNNNWAVKGISFFMMGLSICEKHSNPF